MSGTLVPHPFCLGPGADLRRELESLLSHRGETAGFVLQGMGSLSVANIRFAGRPEPELLKRDFEILTLAGSLALDGAHLHMTIADAAGNVLGGHVARGCIVRTTAELLVAFLPGVRFTREQDAITGYAELGIHRLP